MKSFTSLLGLLTALAVTMSASTGARDAMTLSLDDASSIGLKIETDSVVKTEGAGSVKITTAWPTTVCLGEFSGLDAEAVRLVYKAMVKSELEGEAFLEMWVEVGGGRYFSKGMDNPIKNKSGWKALQTPFILRKGEMARKATLNVVINGTGTIWVDDAVLAKEPLK